MTTTFVSSGVTSTGVTVTSGNALEVLTSGRANSTTVNGGGLLQVDAGGFASASLISSGGFETVLGSDNHDTIDAGATFTVASGGTVDHLTVLGTLNVLGTVTSNVSLS